MSNYTSRALREEIQIASERASHSRAFYVSSRKAYTRANAQLKELRTRANDYRAQGNLALYKSTWEESEALLTRVKQLEEQMDKAKEVADADLAKVKDLKAIQNRGGVLPVSVVEDISRRQAHAEAVKLMTSKGLAPSGPKLIKFEKRLYPAIYKHNQEVNQKGNL